MNDTKGKQTAKDTETSMNNNNAADAMARYRQNQGGLISDTLGGIAGNYAGGKARGFF